jgi:outer membrane immunogenic protein
MKMFWQAAIAVAAMMSASATAADMPVKARPIVEVYNWSGFYIGGNVGAAWGRTTFETATTFGPAFAAVDNAALSSASSPAFRKTGVIGGGQVGYNWQTGNWVWGFEADFDWQGVRQSSTGVFQFPSTLPGGVAGPPAQFFTVATSVNQDWLFTARPRFGFAASNWFLYGTGGLAVGKVNYTQALNLLPPFVTTTSASGTRVGWTAGAGIEYAISRRWSVKGEYLYVDLGRVSSTGAVNPAFAGYVSSTSVRVREDIARLGINYRFDAGPVVARH